MYALPDIEPLQLMMSPYGHSKCTKVETDQNPVQQHFCCLLCQVVSPQIVEDLYTFSGVQLTNPALCRSSMIIPLHKVKNMSIHIHTSTELKFNNNLHHMYII